MKVLSTLIKREYWENYALLYRLPLWLCVIITVLVFTISALSFNEGAHFHGFISGQMQVSTSDPVAHLINDGSFISPIFTVFLWITLFTYALRTLLTDRKDGSIFFWNSMPTTQTQIIVSKVFTLLFVAPFCSWIFLSLSQWIIYIAIFIGHFGAHSHDFSTEHFIVAALTTMFSNLVFLWFVGLWLSPILGLCFISSAYSKRSPAVPVFVILLIACILDLFFTHSHIISSFVLTCFTHSIHGIHAFGYDNPNNKLRTFSGIHFLIGLAIAAFLLTMAGVIRSKNLDFRND